MRIWTTTVFARVGALLRAGLMLGVVGMAIAIPSAIGTIEYTARSEFCNSCHIMEPYYESWANSSHSHVACIECHYEPGALETVEGKFKALSQLSKYVTRTQGTKPWAEVSDQSCMRSGCHTVRMLDGPIDFGRVKFDHRHHLLESRRGRRLRCTSCHSQIVQGDHVSVTESVCITCHFMPVDGEVPAATSDCNLCHGAPHEAIEVAGKPFVHADYLARGVDCRECHDPVVQGDGVVRRDRCHSCHGEVGHIDRFEETEFLHEMHVTEHKVECFECHDQIYHGLLPLETPELGKKDGCGSCHVDSHDATRLMLSGTGANGVADRPSRMFEARVVCAAGHTGRAGPRVAEGGDDPHGAGGAHGAHAPRVKRAGDVDCIHCHGPAVAGMVGGWQAAVEAQLERIAPMVAALEPQVAELGAEGAEALRTARENVRLVQLDGSRGAHNPNYALDVLAAAAERLEEAQARLDPEQPLGALEGFPHRSEAGCSECHLGIEHSSAIALGGSAFSHGVHLERVGLDCTACHGDAAHGAAGHGAPSFPRSECASCHHTESDELDFDPYDCSACHAAQVDFLVGEVEGLDEVPGAMADKDCESCHGEPPDVVLPNVKLCALCHDETYPELPAQWRERTRTLSGELESLIAAARGRGVDTATIAGAERALDVVAADGSGGAHNIDLVERLLGDAIEALDGN